MSADEDLNRQHAVKMSSDRSFGAVFAVIFAIMGLWPLVKGLNPRWWAFGPTAAFTVLSLLKPGWLHPLNVLWNRLGMLLNRIVSPIATGVLFFLAVTPIGLLMRVVGKDPLRLKWEPQSKTYWIERNPPGPDPRTMAQQF